MISSCPATAANKFSAATAAGSFDRDLGGRGRPLRPLLGRRSPRGDLGRNSHRRGRVLLHRGHDPGRHREVQRPQPTPRSPRSRRRPPSPPRHGRALGPARTLAAAASTSARQGVDKGRADHDLARRSHNLSVSILSLDRRSRDLNCGRCGRRRGRHGFGCRIRHLRHRSHNCGRGNGHGRRDRRGRRRGRPRLPPRP